MQREIIFIADSTYGYKRRKFQTRYFETQRSRVVAIR